MSRRPGKIWIDDVPVTSKSVGVKRLVAGEFMAQHLTASVSQDGPLSFELYQMALELATKVRSHDLPPERITRSRSCDCAQPGSWWQMFKRDVLSRSRVTAWIVRRWPPREVTRQHTLTVTVDLDRFRLYPDAPAIPIEGFEDSYAGHRIRTAYKWTTGA